MFEQFRVYVDEEDRKSQVPKGPFNVSFVLLAPGRDASARLLGI
jgi:hypothetical protein